MPVALQKDPVFFDSVPCTSKQKMGLDDEHIMHLLGVADFDIRW